MEFGWEVDPKAQDEGEWKGLDELLPGLEVKVRSVRSPHYRRALSKRSALDPKYRRQGPKADEYRDQVVRELIAQHCILDWRGLRDRDGNEVPFSGDLARELMTDRRHQNFADAVMVASGQVGVPDAEEDEGDDVPSSSAPQSSST